MARPGERRQQGEPGKWARREQGGTGDKGRCVGIMWLGIWLGGEGGVGVGWRPTGSIGSVGNL